MNVETSYTNDFFKPKITEARSSEKKNAERESINRGDSRDRHSGNKSRRSSSRDRFRRRSPNRHERDRRGNSHSHRGSVVLDKYKPVSENVHSKPSAKDDRKGVRNSSPKKK